MTYFVVDKLLFEVIRGNLMPNLSHFAMTLKMDQEGQVIKYFYIVWRWRINIMTYIGQSIIRVCMLYFHMVDISAELQRFVLDIGPQQLNNEKKPTKMYNLVSSHYSLSNEKL